MADQSEIAKFMDDCRAAGIAPNSRGRINETQLAALLGCDKKTIQRMRHEGRGPRWLRVPTNGSSYGYDAADLIDYENTQKGQL